MKVFKSYDWDKKARIPVNASRAQEVGYLNEEILVRVIDQIRGWEAFITHDLDHQGVDVALANKSTGIVYPVQVKRRSHSGCAAWQQANSHTEAVIFFGGHGHDSAPYVQKLERVLNKGVWVTPEYLAEADEAETRALNYHVKVFNVGRVMLLKK
jgi:hypothetical protein